MQKIKYLLPSIADIVFFVLFVHLSISAGKGLLVDCDTGYHIRAGEYILNTLSIPKVDIFSFHSPPMPWTAHEWLSEAIMALVHKIKGLAGVVVFFSFLISITYYIYFRALKRYSNNILLSTFIALLVIASSQIHWLARPHVFSIAFMVIWYYLIDSFQYKDKNLLYFLPLIMLLWVNLHGGFLAGFIILLIYLSANLFYTFYKKSDNHNYKKKIKTFSGITALCLVVSGFNPSGYHILLFPFKLMASKPIIDTISEFMSPNFHDPGILVYMSIFFVMIIVFALSSKKLNLIELSLILVFTYMAMYSVRYIPLFAIISGPIILIRLEDLLQANTNKIPKFLRTRSERFSSIDASTKGYLWPLAGTAFVVFFVTAGQIHYHFDSKLKPVSAVEFLRKEKIAGNMFNSDEFGDYIVYAAWPKYRVFIDGRLDMYGTSIFEEYKDVLAFQPGWEKILEKYKITWMIFSSDALLSRHLLKLDDWKLIYSDKVANIFVKNIVSNKYLIEKYPNVIPFVKDKHESRRD